MPFFTQLINQANYSPEQHVATPLFQSDPFTVMLAGFMPGQSIPEHPGPTGAFYVIDGQGWISIDGERQEVQPGMVAIAPQGTSRGIEAKTQLTLLITRGEPL